MTLLNNVKKWKIFSNFVGFSEHPNFTISKKKLRWFVKNELIFHLFFVYSSKGFTISAKESTEHSSVKNRRRKRKYLLGPAFVWHYSFRNWGSNPPGQFHVLCSDKTEAKKTTKIWIKKLSTHFHFHPNINHSTFF